MSVSEDKDNTNDSNGGSEGQNEPPRPQTPLTSETVQKDDSESKLRETRQDESDTDK